MCPYITPCLGTLRISDMSYYVVVYDDVSSYTSLYAHIVGQTRANRTFRKCRKYNYIMYKCAYKSITVGPMLI